MITNKNLEAIANSLETVTTRNVTNYDIVREAIEALQDNGYIVLEEGDGSQCELCGRVRGGP